jgi:Rad3-related DNA helicase
MDYIDWRPFFPEPVVRPIQAQILDFLTQFWDDADTFFVEAPPGVGKSAIAVALAKWHRAREMANGEDLSKTYITTTTIDLEDQYIASYASKGLAQLHSASHYTCHRKGRYGLPLNCEQGRAVSSTLNKSCSETSCPYSSARRYFAGAPFGIVNAAYLLTESYYVGKLGIRGLLIADEGHTLTEALCSFFELKITPQTTEAVKIPFPRIAEGPDDMERFLAWVLTEYQPKLIEKINALRHEISMWKIKSAPEDDPTFQRYVEDLEKAASESSRITALLTRVDPDWWVLERENKKGKESIALAPITSRGFAKEMLANISVKKVLLSATMIDFEYHTAELEINQERLGEFRAESPFPLEHRWIYQAPRVKFDYTRLEESAREAAKTLVPILEGHYDERGIIFVSSFDQAIAVRDAVNSAMRNDRLATHKNSAEKKLLKQRHRARSDSVMISPSMHEGIDLIDDLSRFQIVAKLPFPNLKSRIVQKRKEMVPEWYAYTTALKIIQATGRSVRTETDSATTYIVDRDWSWFYPRNKHLFPEWWQAALLDYESVL